MSAKLEQVCLNLWKQLHRRAYIVNNLENFLTFFGKRSVLHTWKICVQAGFLPMQRKKRHLHKAFP